MERLQKRIADLGYCSRRKAEELIEKGRVMVNGEMVVELGTKVKPSDLITIDGSLLNRNEKEYYLLHKPKAVVSTASDNLKRKTVIQLIDTNNRIYPVGRLDYDTTGLIILTNDGTLANLIMHPKNKVEKVYMTKIMGKLLLKQINQVKQGIRIDDSITSPAKLKIVKYDKTKDISTIRITIVEGRNNQIKKMFKAIGSQVLKLKREKVGFLDLKGIGIGQYRKITPKEVKKLYNEYGGN